MTRLQTILLGALLLTTPALVRAVSPEDRPSVAPVVRDVRAERFPGPVAVAHVQFVQVTDQGEEVPGGEKREGTVLLYLDPTETDGQEAPAGLAHPDLRALTWYLVVNCAPEGSRCDTSQPSLLLFANAMSPVECPAQDGVD